MKQHNADPPLKVHAGDEAAEFRKRALQSDQAFKRAMLEARRGQQEHFALGVIETPSTAHPKRIAAESLPLSASAMADL